MYNMKKILTKISIALSIILFIGFIVINGLAYEIHKKMNPHLYGNLILNRLTPECQQNLYKNKKAVEKTFLMPRPAPEEWEKIDKITTKFCVQYGINTNDDELWFIEGQENDIQKVFDLLRHMGFKAPYFPFNK